MCCKKHTLKAKYVTLNDIFNRLYHILKHCMWKESNFAADFWFK